MANQLSNYPAYAVKSDDSKLKRSNQYLLKLPTTVESKKPLNLKPIKNTDPKKNAYAANHGDDSEKPNH